MLLDAAGARHFVRASGCQLVEGRGPNAGVSREKSVWKDSGARGRRHSRAGVDGHLQLPRGEASGEGLAAEARFLGASSREPMDVVRGGRPGAAALARDAASIPV